MTTIRVYTKPDCKQCDLTKDLLTKKGLEFEVADITEPGNLEAAKSLGLTSAPVVIVQDDVHSPAESWAGFRPDLIEQVAKRIETGETA